MLFNNNGSIDRDESVDMSTDAYNYIMEAMMVDNLSKEELSTFLENRTEVQAAMDENVLLERTIVRLDKHAKLSKARKMAIFTIAKEKNDPRFKKLLKVWKMERYLEAELDKKYGNEASRRAKKAVSKAGNSKANAVKKAAAKAKSQFNAPVKKPIPKPEFINLNK